MNNQHDSLIGQTLLGNYVIEEPIGHGAMGTVFSGRHRVLGRRVAVKVLRHHLIADKAELQRFHDEAEAIAKLSHPNVVTILDFGTTSDGIPCIVTEFISGETLLEVLDMEGPLEPWRATRLIQQVLSALIEAHSMGIIHRDIKSDNIMIQRLQDGREQVKLVDFGISLVEGRADRDAGFIFGTPLYMSPEQCRGDQLDDKTDLYSLGVVFYELLTGEPLFDFDDPYDFLKAHKQEQPRKPSEIADQAIPEALEQVILKLLEKDKSSRYCSAQEVKQALHGWEVSRSSIDTKQSTWRGSSPAESIPESSDKALEAVYEQVSSALNRINMPSEPHRVLVLEKNQEIASILVKMLTHMGVNVVHAPAPRAAEVLLADESCFDLFLLAQEPHSGESVSRLMMEILKSDPLAEIVLMAGFSDIHEIGKKNGWRVSDFLVKPFRSFRAFAGHVRAALKRRETNIVHSTLIREAMKVLGNNKDPVSFEIHKMLESMSSVPAALVARVSEPACYALRERGHTVLEGRDKATFHRLLARRGLHVVLLDSSVLEDSLLETTADVISKRPDLEVILVGKEEELKEMVEGVELGASDFLVKPTEGLDVLIQKVDLAVSRRVRRLKIRKLAKTLESMAASSKKTTLKNKIRMIRKALNDTVTMKAQPAEETGISRGAGLKEVPSALVAEPDKMVRSLLSAGLKALGWNCIPAGTIEDAAREIRNAEFDLLILSDTGTKWNCRLLIEDAARFQYRTPIATVFSEKDGNPHVQVPGETHIGFLSKPFKGLGAIHDILQKGLRRKHELMSPNTSGAKPCSSESAMRILAVEQNPEILRKLEDLFKTERFPMLRAESMEEALHKLQRYEMDAVIVNLDLLVHANENVLNNTRSLWTDAPLLSYSDKTGKEQALSAMAFGAKAFLPNPLHNPESFLSRLKEHGKSGKYS